MADTNNLNQEVGTEEVHTPSGIEAIGIDGGFLLAQIVNFILLFLILRAFVFKPVLKVLNERKKTIEESLSLAEETARKAQATSEEAMGIIAEARVEAKEILENAKARANNIAEEISKKAQDDAESLTAKTKDLLSKERDLIVESAQKELANLLSKSLEKVLENKKIEFSPEELNLAIQKTKETR